MQPATTQECIELAALQAEWPGWRLWRARRKHKGRWEPGSWMASRRDPAAGVSPTLMEDTAARLRAALIDQRERVLGGDAGGAVPVRPQ